MNNKTIKANNNNEIKVLIEKKIYFFQDVIQKTIIHIQSNKILDIINISEVNSCINELNNINNKIKNINDLSSSDNIINILQEVNNDLSSLFKLYGTESLEDLLWICFGNVSINTYLVLIVYYSQLICIFLAS
jgi:hypothetical protein